MDRDYKIEYKKWLDEPALDEVIRTELEEIGGDDKEIRERFSRLISFGTAGLRGIMRAGLNGMNLYTVRLASMALAKTIEEDKGAAEGAEPFDSGGVLRIIPSVTIAFDSRNNSQLFAKEAARVIAAMGIKVYLFESLRPTPELSFALRQTKSVAGINITASHNTKEYNGFKIYWEDGAQIAPERASRIAKAMETMDPFSDVEITDFDEAVKDEKIQIIGGEIDEAYIASVLSQSVGAEYVEKTSDSLKIVFTPFHGTGYKLVPQVLSKLGIKHLLTVGEQMVIDGDFPTVKSPNPEYGENFELAIRLAQKEDVDLIIGTDPDGDRCGVVIREKGEYRALTGNQIGVLLLDYIIKLKKENNTLNSDSAAIKSIVSTTMADRICAEQGVEMINVLTGFKYIGEKIKEFEETGGHTFLFGFEESNGYLKGTYSRDKDAVLASMLIAEMACYYHMQDKTLADGLQDLYQTYGQYREKVLSFIFEGLEGRDEMSGIMERLRTDPPLSIGLDVIKIRDYADGRITDTYGNDRGATELSGSDILFYELENDCTAIIRPSGTEPKIKFYIMTRGETSSEAEDRLEAVETAARKMIRAEAPGK